MEKVIPKSLLFYALLLHAGVLCLGQQSLSEERILIANGKNAETGRFESFVSVEYGQDFFSGVLITPNVVMFPAYYELIIGNSVTIGRFGDLEVKQVSNWKEIQLNPGSTADNSSFYLAVLDSASTKTPATIDAGNCETASGCLNVSVVGRGLTSFSSDNNSDVDLGVKQPLQQADFTLLDPSSCINHFDRERMYYDIVYGYFASYYGCADLECANKTHIIKRANQVNDDSMERQERLIDHYEDLFQASDAVCLKTLEAGICEGDNGAPVYTEDDILVGIVLSSLCWFQGVYDILPVSIRFTAGLVEKIEAGVAGLLNLECDNPSLTRAAAGSCSCVESNAVTCSSSVLLVLLTAMMLTSRTLI